MLVRVNKKLSLLIIGIAMPILFMIWKFSQPVLPKTYQEAVQYTKAINMKEMRSKLANGDEFVVYIGRESCPYCQKFVPNLALAIQKSHQTVYYLDSASDEKDEITAFAKEMDIQTVPNLSVYQNGSKSRYLEQGSSASLEEILSFLKHE
ncbi:MULTISPECIES: thioredoxin domain-containing protein [Streptococcus]|uniref:thioredoxin domain-containing protein n=1 Tax=Streptococcus TaxID=1301 RepID=UPI00080B7142|nr:MULTISPECIES: thioredoxin domain-containing protein [Streptococcus]